MRILVPGFNAGTPIEGITVSGGVGLLGIDNQAFDSQHPAMGAYAQPVNDDKPTPNPQVLETINLNPLNRRHLKLNNRAYWEWKKLTMAVFFSTLGEP